MEQLNEEYNALFIKYMKLFIQTILTDIKNDNMTKSNSMKTELRALYGIYHDDEKNTQYCAAVRAVGQLQNHFEEILTMPDNICTMFYFLFETRENRGRFLLEHLKKIIKSISFDEETKSSFIEQVDELFKKDFSRCRDEKKEK